MFQSLLHFLTTPNEIVQFCSVQFWLMFIVFLVVYALIYMREAKTLQRRLQADEPSFWAKARNWRLAYVIAFSLRIRFHRNGGLPRVTI